MTATIIFATNKGTKWRVTKQFNNDEHLNNFINYICRTKNYLCDKSTEQQTNNYE